MCRTTDYYPRSTTTDDRFIRLKSISISLSPTTATTESFLSQTLTLVFLPRINGGFLEINAVNYKPDSPAFISLHRACDDSNGGGVFVSFDEVRACDGVVFEVYLGENDTRLIHGVLRRGDDGVLKVEMKSVLRKDCGVKEVEFRVLAGNGVVLREAVEVVVRKKKRGKFCKRFEVALDEIPEERESDVADEEGSGVVCCCSCGEGEEGESGSDGGDEVDLDLMELEMEKEIEGVKWAVDVGIWAVCLGVGFFVTRASARNLRRRRFLL